MDIQPLVAVKSHSFRALRVKTMRLIQLAILVCLSGSVMAEEKIIPEEVLVRWGFKTLEVTEFGQMIKSSFSFKVSGQVYYPRYYLRKDCFGSVVDAQHRMEFIATTPSNGKDELRGDFFLAGKCVYQIDPNADIFKYHDKSNIVEEFGNYVQNNT